VKPEMMTLNQLTQVCGFFSEESSVNNYYNCLHPENEDQEEDETLNKKIGKCIHFYCPVASDQEEEDFDGWSGDHKMQIHDETLLKKLSQTSDTKRMGVDG